MATILCAARSTSARPFFHPGRNLTSLFCVWWNSNQRLMHQSVFWSAFETRFHVRFLASLIIDGPNRNFWLTAGYNLKGPGINLLWMCAPQPSVCVRFVYTWVCAPPIIKRKRALNVGNKNMCACFMFAGAPTHTLTPSLTHCCCCCWRTWRVLQVKFALKLARARERETSLLFDTMTHEKWKKNLRFEMWICKSVVYKPLPTTFGQKSNYNTLRQKDKLLHLNSHLWIWPKTMLRSLCFPLLRIK
jgi:hypothetical protein